MNNNFSPNKSITSRYSLKSISNRYQTMSISGSTNLPLATLKSDGTYTQGYIYAPYIISDTIDINSEWYKIFLQYQRKQKLEKLEKLQNE